MYYFENLNLDFISENAPFSRGFELFSEDENEEFQNAEKSEKMKLIEVIKLGAKFRRHLFDDYSFYLGAKTKLEADFECAMRIIEIVSEVRENFKIIRSKNGEFAGFWYLYDINYAKSFDNDSMCVMKTPVNGCFAGCLKKSFWGKPAREIMRLILENIFCEMKFKKIKCETFSSNPYITSFLSEFGLALEGYLQNETQICGKSVSVGIWGLERVEFEKKIFAKEKGVEPLDFTSRSINNKSIIPKILKK